MLPKNKVLAIIKSKSGVSLIFVLGIMLMLFAIGGAVISGTNANVNIGSSVTGAATANFASNIRQNQYNRAVLLGDSIHRTIRQSLLDSSSATSLARKLPEELYNKRQLIFDNRTPDFDADEKVEEIVFDFKITTGPAAVTDANYTIKIIFPMSLNNPSIEFNGPMAAMPELGEGFTTRTPRTAAINAKIVVEVEVFLQGTDGRKVTTLAAYDYRGGVFSDASSDRKPDDITFDDSLLVFTEFGVWEMVSYEITES